MIHLKEPKENKESVEDKEVSHKDGDISHQDKEVSEKAQLVQTESSEFYSDQDEPRSPDIVIESSDLSSNNKGPAPIFQSK